MIPLSVRSFNRLRLEAEALHDSDPGRRESA